MTFELGDDPELIEIRNRIPEPSRVDYPVIRAKLPNKCKFEYWSKAIIIPYDCLNDSQTVEFFKVKIEIPRTVIFFAWQSRRDNKIYL